MHTHPTPLPVPTLFLGILLFDSFENVYYFLLHILWCQLQWVSAISIVFVLKRTVTLKRGLSIFYLLHPISPPTPPPPPPPLPPSLTVSFWKVGLRYHLGPSDISFKLKSCNNCWQKIKGSDPSHVWGKGGEGWTLTLTLKLHDFKKRTDSDSSPAFYWHPIKIAFMLLRNIYLRTKDSDEIIPSFALLSPNLQYRRSAWISSFRTENFLKIIRIDGVNRRFAAKQYVVPKYRTMLREQPIS